MNWIAEATSMYSGACGDGGRRIVADACGQCWTAFEAMKNPEPESPVPLKSGAAPADTQEPVAWYGYAVRADGGFCKSLDFSQKDVERELAQNARTVIEIVPLYRQPQPTLTDERAVAKTEGNVWLHASNKELSDEVDRLTAEVNRLEAWRDTAMKFGESIVTTGPTGYYDFTPAEWMDWATQHIHPRSPSPATLTDHEFKMIDNLAFLLEQYGWKSYAVVLKSLLVKLGGRVEKEEETRVRVEDCFPKVPNQPGFMRWFKK